jgi:hypothetical protein
MGLSSSGLSSTRLFGLLGPGDESISRTTRQGTQCHISEYFSLQLSPNWPGASIKKHKRNASQYNRLVVNFASRQLCPQERASVPNKKGAVRASFGEEIRNPNHPIVDWCPRQICYPVSPKMELCLRVQRYLYTNMLDLIVNGRYLCCH